MKKKTTSQSAHPRRSPGEGGFFNLRVLIALFIGATGVSLALFAANPLGPAKGPANTGPDPASQAQGNYDPRKAAFDPLVPAAFDCSKIRELGIDKQENMRAQAIMIFCGQAEGGKPSPAAAFSQFLQDLLPSPLAYG